MICLWSRLASQVLRLDIASVFDVDSLHKPQCQGLAGNSNQNETEALKKRREWQLSLKARRISVIQNMKQNEYPSKF